MKNSTLIFLLSLLVLWGCNNAPATLSDADKEQIKKEVLEDLEIINDAVNNHDFEKMMEYCWNDPDYLYAANGSLVKGWDANYKIASEIHSNPKNQSFTLKYDDTIITVLSQDLVMLTAKGQFIDFPIENDTKNIDLVVTFLVQKIGGKWKIIVGHESTNDPIF